MQNSEEKKQKKWSFQGRGIKINLYFEERLSILGRIQQLFLEIDKMSYRYSLINLSEAYIRGRGSNELDIFRIPENNSIIRSITNECQSFFSPPVIQDEMTNIQIHQDLKNKLEILSFDFENGFIQEIE